MPQNKIFTVKDLKELLNSLDDDARVVILDEDNDELFHSQACYEINDGGELAIYVGERLKF